MNIKDYFSFTRSEKRGVVVMLFIIALLLVTNLSVDFLKVDNQTDFSEFEKEIDAYEKDINTIPFDTPIEFLAIECFEFNPNTISDEEWKKLGFKDWQIKTIFNYKAKGGSWKTKTDVAKIYGLEEAHFKRLKPYILLPQKKDNKKNQSTNKKETVKIEYFKFDPNTIAKKEWKQLGFKDWQIKTIFNYKAKGGSWKTKTDVQQIYGLNDTDYFKLEPYILLPEKSHKEEALKNTKDYSIKVDINSADVTALTKLKGIFSEKYAAIIIKHRDKLGGFTSKEELKEVWNMTDETYNGFIKQVILGQYEPKKININSSSASQLQTHPYIDWKTANAIFKFRKANGNYKKIEDIKKIHLIPKKTYLKIAPYLIVD